jgi:hypothetical protein
MDIGDGIAIGSGAFASLAAFLKIVEVKFPRASNGNGVKKHCEDHSGVCIEIGNFKEWLDKVEKKLDRVIENRK